MSLGPPNLGRPNATTDALDARYGAAIDLHDGERIIFEGHPSWRAILSFYLQGLLVVAVLAGILALVTAVSDEVNWGLLGAIVVVGGAVVVLIGFIRRIATVYTITNQRLRIKRGILAKKVQQTRIDRVQNVNTEQTVIDRLLRVGTVDFDTAGTDDSDFTFAGVSSPGRVVEAVDRAQHAAVPEQSAEPQL
jgi:uncharacterized membrane protein YdbT with pleckstrin-like domain